VLVAELAMLRKLRFQVGTPTAHDFLQSLGLRVIGDDVPEACLHLGDFLLQLTLADALLHYRYPHAVLAASALILALSTFAAPQARYIALLEDFALHCPEASASHAALVQCCSSVHMLWVRSIGTSEQTTYARHVCLKFSRVGNHQVSTMIPPAMPPQCLPPSSPIPLVPPPQDDVEEAMGVVRQSLMLDGSSRPSAAAQALESGETNRQPRHTRCTRCGRAWPPLAETAGLCIECSRAANAAAERDDTWSGPLASRLRSLAEASWKVRSVLARHGWSGGRFRHPPNREALLRDLARVSRAAPGSVQAASAVAAAAVVGYSQSYVPPARSRIDRAPRGLAPGGTGASPSGEPRRTKASLRSASWCGHHHSALSAHTSHAPIRLGRSGAVTRSP
jgi:hypothetical protein